METYFEEEDVDQAQILPAQRPDEEEEKYVPSKPEEEDVDVNIERVVTAATRIIAELVSPETRAA